MDRLPWVRLTPQEVVLLPRPIHDPDKTGFVHPLRHEEDGFQTAEAIGIAAVGLLVLFGIWGAMSTLGVDVIDWIRDTFGVGGMPG